MATRPPKPVETYRHKSEKRSNLPTEQTSIYMGKEDRKGILYKPELHSREGPLLSWDRDVDLENVETEATPLYIHEKIHPATFAKSLESKISGGGEEQGSLFADFNNLPENASYEWYQHAGNWQNRIIRGEARHVLASLLAKEGMAGKVQMVFFDPPYGIGFKSNMQVNASKRDVGGKGGGKDIPNDLGVIKAFRDTYKNGIHSYFDNIFRIAALARNLLHESGSFFLQIGSDNVHRLAVVLDEVFGHDNHVATIPFKKSGSTSSNTLPQVADYLLWYARDNGKVKYRQLYESLDRKGKLKLMNWDAMVELADEEHPRDRTVRPLTNEEKEDLNKLPEGAKLFMRVSPTSQGESETRSSPYIWKGVSYPCPPGRQWSVGAEGLHTLDASGRFVSAGKEGSNLSWKRYEEEIPGRKINNLWATQMKSTDMHYVVETAESVLQRCILMTTDPGDLVLDPTCGSGTTAFVAERWGRRWITTDCATVAVSLARQRLVTGAFKYWLLRDSQEGEVKDAELADRSPDLTRSWNEDPAKGFVYDRVPSVSAGILAYGTNSAPTLLVDQPFAKHAAIRVSSPFTVESHSPYRVVPPDAAEDMLASTSPDMTRAIITALETSGINAGHQRIHISDIEEWTSVSQASWITHSGRSGDPESISTAARNTAIMIAPEDCTVSPQMVQRAAEQTAMQATFDTLVVIAFCFEPGVRSPDVESRGRLKIYNAQAHQDLRIRNLSNQTDDRAFVLIGEPDIRIELAENDEIIVEVVGYETYDPASGNLRSHSTNGVGNENSDIQCWMIDTDYDGLSFFAHRIHFPGGKNDNQIKGFCKSLGRRLAPELRDSMYSLKSAPFRKPKNGRIAVRIVTNTYTEMTSVIDID